MTLAQTLPHVHLYIEEETLVIALKKDIVTPATTECVNQPTIIFPREPTLSTIDLLDRIGLSYVSMVRDGVAREEHALTMRLSA